MVKIQKAPVKGKALLIFQNGNCVVYRRGFIYLYDENYRLLNTLRIKKTLKESVFTACRLLERCRHIEPKWAVSVSDNTCLLQWIDSFILVDFENGKISYENPRIRGRALTATKVEKIPGFEDGIVICDYGSNDKRNNVNIYHRNGSGKWKIKYSFSAGTIRHIHAVVMDRNNNCAYILTGDEDNESGIWKATEDFSCVEILLMGSQQYRSCQLWKSQNRLFYATDAPSEKNHIYAVENGIISKICDLRGTGIYGTRMLKGMLLSTTCEPDVNSRTRIQKMLTARPGKGVVGRNVDVLYIDEKGNAEVVYNFKHDGLPLRLMQYGTVTFSNCCHGRTLMTALNVKNEDMSVYEVKES